VEKGEGWVMTGRKNLSLQGGKKVLLQRKETKKEEEKEKMQGSGLNGGEGSGARRKGTFQETGNGNQEYWPGAIRKRGNRK